MNNPRVMLINLSTTTFKSNELKPQAKTLNRDSKLGLEHLGLLYLGTLLDAADIQTEVCDLAFKEYHGERIDLEECISTVNERKPDVVGFSPYFTSIDGTLYATRQIKSANPKIKIVLGGSHASHTANEILRENSSIDAIFLGETFHTITPAVEALLNNYSLENVEGVAFRSNKNVVNNGWGQKIPLDKLPLPKRSDKMYTKTKTASMMFTMGCPAACAFCSAESLRDRSWRSRSIDNLIAEIDDLVRQFDIKVIETHSDDGFGPGGEAVLHYTTLARKLIERGYNIKWRSALRATDFKEKGVLLDDDLWNSLHQSGLERVYIGFEAGTNERLKKIRKPATVESNLRAFKFLTDKKIAVQYGFIMFFPDSSTKEIGDNLDFLYALNNTSYSHNSSSLIIHPGSAYFDMYRINGRLQYPYYGLQHYEFSDIRVGQMYDAFRQFASSQQPIDILCNDITYATIAGNNSVLHLGHTVKADPTMLERRAKDLHRTGKRVLQNSGDAVVILRQFDDRWRNEYLRYLKENARVA